MCTRFSTGPPVAESAQPANDLAIFWFLRSLSLLGAGEYIAVEFLEQQYSSSGLVEQVAGLARLCLLVAWPCGLACWACAGVARHGAPPQALLQSLLPMTPTHPITHHPTDLGLWLAARIGAGGGGGECCWPYCVALAWVVTAGMGTLGRRLARHTSRWVALQAHAALFHACCCLLGQQRFPTDPVAHSFLSWLLLYFF